MWKIPKQNTPLHMPFSSWERYKSSSIWQMLVKLFNAFLKVFMNTSKTLCKQKLPPNLPPQLHIKLHCSCCWDRSMLKFHCFARFTLKLGKKKKTSWEEKDDMQQRQAQTGHLGRCWVSTCQVSNMLSLGGRLDVFMKEMGVIRPSHGA